MLMYTRTVQFIYSTLATNQPASHNSFSLLCTCHQCNTMSALLPAVCASTTDPEALPAKPWRGCTGYPIAMFRTGGPAMPSMPSPAQPSLYQSVSLSASGRQTKRKTSLGREASMGWDAWSLSCNQRRSLRS
ncbi:hypothetical protein V8C35DRAFT_308914 [Trichoderma chlorosporum]